MFTFLCVSKGLASNNDQKSAWAARATVKRVHVCDYSSSTPNLFLLLKYCLLLVVSKDWLVNGDASSIWVPDYWKESCFLWIFLTHSLDWSEDLPCPETDSQPSLEGAVDPASPNLPLRSSPHLLWTTVQEESSIDSWVGTFLYRAVNHDSSWGFFLK